MFCYNERIKENAEIVLSIEVEQMLIEFSNVVPKDVPQDLLPMRDIQHAIVFIHGSVIPNRPAYGMSLRGQFLNQPNVRLSSKVDGPINGVSRTVNATNKMLQTQIVVYLNAAKQGIRNVNVKEDYYC